MRPRWPSEARAFCLPNCNGDLTSRHTSSVGGAYNSGVSAAEPDHVRIDALVLIGIANPFTETVYANPLSMVLAVVDTYEHSVLSAKEVEHAVRDLSGAGLICVNGLSFRLTAQGESAWRKIQSVPMMHEQYQLAIRVLRGIPCVADKPGWSLDERVWEDAFAGYSSQFALELKRRRNGT